MIMPFSTPDSSSEPTANMTRIPLLQNPHALVLSNPDILEEIFENLSVDYVWEMEQDEIVSRRKVLFNAALTCRGFLQPALDRLWRSLDKLFPLFKLLPAFYRSDSTFVLRGHITDEDWSRFDSYARRVKTFSYTRDPDSLDIAMHVYFRVAQLRREPLLPCLRYLRCPHISQDDFLISSICLFLTPSLNSIEFEKITAVEDKLVGTFLHTLLCDDARLEYVSLAGEGLTRDTLSYLGRLKYLRSLVVMGMGLHVDLEFIRSIGSIPGLMRLQLDLEGTGLVSVTESDVLVDSSSAGDGEFGFRELDSLELIAPLSFVKNMVLQIGTTQLSTIAFESGTEGVVDRKNLLTTIVKRWKDTLVDVRMVHSDTVDDAIVTVISMDTISPLLPLTRLTHLELDGYNMELSDGNIAELARAWPSIVTLHLPFMSSGAQRPTVAALRILADRCPDLKNLTIPLDTSIIISMPEDKLSRHPLEKLSIASSDDPWEVRDALVLARFIDHLFPILTKVTAHEGREAGRWQQVHEMIKMYQSVRAEAVALCCMSSGEDLCLTLNEYGR